MRTHPSRCHARSIRHSKFSYRFFSFCPVRCKSKLVCWTTNRARRLLSQVTARDVLRLSAEIMTRMLPQTQTRQTMIYPLQQRAHRRRQQKGNFLLSKTSVLLCGMGGRLGWLMASTITNWRCRRRWGLKSKMSHQRFDKNKANIKIKCCNVGWSCLLAISVHAVHSHLSLPMSLSQLMRQQRFLVLRSEQMEVLFVDHAHKDIMPCPFMYTTSARCLSYACTSLFPASYNCAQIYWGRTSVSIRSPVKGKTNAGQRRLVTENRRHKHTWTFESEVGMQPTSVVWAMLLLLC